ncbi:MAG: hypothetical protein WCK98_01965 [bacterium]
MVNYYKADFEYWNKHFIKNTQNRIEPEWQMPMNLSPKILKYLVPSLEQFQLGDGGGPASLIAWNAESFRNHSPQMKHLVDERFREEKEHSRLLGKSLDRFGGTPIKTHWSFEIFCFLRKILGVRMELIILLCTEITSTIYYRLLHKYTPDKPFKDMCLLILRDEADHINFHRNRLALAGKDGVSRYGFLYKSFMRFCTIAAGTVLWSSHGKTLRVLGATTKEFYRGINLELDQFLTKLENEIDL